MAYCDPRTSKKIAAARKAAHDKVQAEKRKKNLARMAQVAKGGK